jgi:hypothetical protein
LNGRQPALSEDLVRYLAAAEIEIAEDPALDEVVSGWVSRWCIG